MSTRTGSADPVNEDVVDSVEHGTPVRSPSHASDHSASHFSGSRFLSSDAPEPVSRKRWYRSRQSESADDEDGRGASVTSGATLPHSKSTRSNQKAAGKRPRLRSATVSEANSPLFEPEEDDYGAAQPAEATFGRELPKSKSVVKFDPGLARAIAMKHELETNAPTKKKAGRRGRVESDPENILIKDLRVKYHMSWDSIAEHLNKRRLERGEPQTYTMPAVYSRFIRNAPRIAKANGEVGFDPKDYMYLRHPHTYPHLNNTGYISAPRRGRGLVGADGGMPRELQGNVRKRSGLAQEAQEMETTEKTEMLIDAVAVINRNFWTFVADEMERSSGKLYDPRVLESRYKQL